MYYVYIIFSPAFNKYYVGSSSNPWKRLVRHNTTDFNTYSSKYRPWELAVTFEAANTRGEAERLEKFIKKQKSRSLIQKLIDPAFLPSGQLAQLVRVPHLRD